MFKKENKTNTQRLGLVQWLFNRPIKFALTMLGLSILGVCFYTAIMSYFSAGQVPVWPTTILMAIFVILCIWRMIKRLPNSDIDKRSFIAINNAIICITLVLLVIYALLASKIMLPMIILLNSPFISIWTALYALAGLLLMAVISLYTLGVVIEILYSTYLRARAMGVPKWKAIFSMPFSMLWLAGYLLPDTQPKTAAIATRAAWYDKLSKYIAEKPTANITVCLILLASVCLFYGIHIWLYILVPLVVYAIWRIVAGAQSMRKNVGGKFATAAVILNILLLCWLLLTLFYPRLNVPSQTSIEIHEAEETMAI